MNLQTAVSDIFWNYIRQKMWLFWHQVGRVVVNPGVDYGWIGPRANGLHPWVESSIEGGVAVACSGVSALILHNEGAR